MTKKWRHEAIMMVAKGKVRVHCKCGDQSPRFALDAAGVEEADKWYLTHTKLIEVQQGKKKEES